MPVSRQRERELTFDVEPGWVVPDLTSMVPTGGCLERATYELEATYFDTQQSALRGLGMSLRHRHGGSDAGWHLKVPVGDARTEVHSSAAPGTVPQALARRVAGVAAGERVASVASVATTRRVTKVLDAGGELVLEVADDVVSGRASKPGADVVEWREVEVELGAQGCEDDLAGVAELFEQSGARPAAVARKINHVLGEPDRPSLDGLGGLVADYVAAQCAAVLLGDVLLRDDPTSEFVHRTRVAIRRLRSTIRIFGSAFDLAASDLSGLDADLKWLAEMLSPIRDGDILARRLERELGQLAPDDVVGPVRAEIGRTLTADRAGAIARFREARRDERYLRVMSTLGSWYASPPVHANPPVHPHQVLKTARRKVRRRLAGATDAHEVHQARKAAKRLRYAADLLEPHDKTARRTAKRAKRMQTRLGEHQDLVVAAAFLRRQAAGAVRSAFTYGVLMARVEQQAAKVRRRL